MPPTLGNGKICYLEIPAGDLRRSIDFYQRVFGWQIRERGDGQVAFDDAVGEVSGTWVTGRPSSPEPGLLIYIMVDDAAAIVETIAAHGGEIVQPIAAMPPRSPLDSAIPLGTCSASIRSQRDRPEKATAEPAPRPGTVVGAGQRYAVARREV
jgi:uncharacterized protein